jgi:hypothetical protein
MNPAHRLKAARRLRGEPAVLPRRVGGQRRLDAFKKNEIVRRRLGRTADRREPLDPVEEQGSPMERLLRSIVRGADALVWLRSLPELPPPSGTLQESKIRPEVGLELLSNQLGNFDLSGYHPDGPLPDVPEAAMRSRA